MKSLDRQSIPRWVTKLQAGIRESQGRCRELALDPARTSGLAGNDSLSKRTCQRKRRGCSNPGVRRRVCRGWSYLLHMGSCPCVPALHGVPTRCPIGPFSQTSQAYFISSFLLEMLRSLTAPPLFSTVVSECLKMPAASAVTRPLDASSLACHSKTNQMSILCLSRSLRIGGRVQIRGPHLETSYLGH